jgi:hypothetical protein
MALAAVESILEWDDAKGWNARFEKAPYPRGGRGRSDFGCGIYRPD